jgi:peptide/nickel transport system permease protein
MPAGRRQFPWFPGVILTTLIVTAVFAPYLSPHSPTDGDITRKLIPPVWMEQGNWEHPLGTDRFGRDVLSRIIYGSRISLAVSLVAIFVAGTLGTMLGLISGYRGGLTDAALM